MFVALVLRPERSLAGRAPCVFLRYSQVLVQLRLVVEAEQAGHTDKPVIHLKVVLEVVLKSLLVFESAETQVAESLVAPCVVNVVLETITIFEHTNAEVTVVLVVWCLLCMALECGLVGKLQVACAAPVLVRVMKLVAACCEFGDCACTILCARYTAIE